MSEPVCAESLDHSSGSLWKLLAMAVAVAIAAFFIPQDVPLAWYPRDDPGDDNLYLEIACAANQAGQVQIFYNPSTGISEFDSIRFPISPTPGKYTYVFPLPDAPLTEFRLDPVGNGGTLTVGSLRVLDRRAKEIRRFLWEDIIPVQQIASVRAIADGWEITSIPHAEDPFINLRLATPILAKDLNQRNLLRCAYSSGYLAVMLWIFLLAALFAFQRPPHWRAGARQAAFLAAVALLFSVVGNRGLITSSMRYARFPLPTVPPGAALEIDVAINQPQSAQLFWDTGRGFNETESARCAYKAHPGLQTLRFPLPATAIKALRFDPLDSEAHFIIQGLRVVDMARRTRVLLPVTALTADREIAAVIPRDQKLEVATVKDARDPILMFDPAAVRTIDQAKAVLPAQ